MRRTRRIRVTVGLAGVVALGVLAGAKPPGFERMPGEVVLTEIEQAETLRGADDNERARLAQLFDDERTVLPVAYTRAYYQVKVHADGTVSAVEVGRTEPTPGSHLRLPNLRTAATSGSTTRYDLYTSVGIGRLSGAGYRWVVANYFRWNGSNGIDPCNIAEDSIAVAWAGGLTLYNDASYGYYRPYGSTISPLDIYRSDGTPNVGIGWSFHELKRRNSQTCTNVHWGAGDAYLSESSWQNKKSNVMVMYVHTKGSDSYSLGFSLPGGIGPRISVSPADSNQWGTAAYADFNH